MIILYAQIDDALHQPLLDANLSLFTPDYRQKISRYRRWEDAQLSLLGRLLISEGFLHFGVKADLKQLRFTQYDKPYFSGSRVFFNVSHSGEYVVALFSDQQQVVGIDIEKINEVGLEDFTFQMTPNEQQRIFSAADPLHEFFQYWTEKEAVLKAHGDGLNLPLKSFEVKEGHASIGREMFFVQAVDLVDGYLCHTATLYKEGIREIRQVDVSTFT